MSVLSCARSWGAGTSDHIVHFPHLTVPFFSAQQKSKDEVKLGLNDKITSGKNSSLYVLHNNPEATNCWDWDLQALFHDAISLLGSVARCRYMINEAITTCNNASKGGVQYDQHGHILGHE